MCFSPSINPLTVEDGLGSGFDQSYSKRQRREGLPRAAMSDSRTIHSVNHKLLASESLFPPTMRIAAPGSRVLAFYL
jgi:hypothetical protein